MPRPIVIVVSIVALLTLVVSTAYAWNDARAKAIQEHKETVSWRDEGMVHVVQPGDTLFKLSERYYGDAARWRLIARDNNISDPNMVAVGARLRISCAMLGLTSDLTTEASPASTALIAVNRQPLATLPIRLAPIRYEQASAIAESNGESVIISIRANLGDGYSTLLTQSYTDRFRYMYAEDGDHDGKEELYTVWGQGEDAYFTRVFRDVGNGVAYSEAIPNNPWAMKHDPTTSW